MDEANYNSVAKTASKVSDGVMLALWRTNTQTNDVELNIVKLTGEEQSNGALDDSFGDNGRMSISNPDNDLNPIKILEKSDGSYYLISDRRINNYGTRGINIQKITANGAIDQTFGDNGVVNHTLGDSLYQVGDALIDANDNLFISGGLYSYQFFTDTGEGPGYLNTRVGFVLKCDENGAVDLDYGNSSFTGASVFSYFTNTRQTFADEINFCPNGDILVTGSVQIPSGSNNHSSYPGMARLDANGQLVDGFGDNQSGSFYSDFDGTYAYFTDAEVMDDGTILVLGSYRESMDIPSLTTVFILDENGSLIATSNDEGRFTFGQEFFSGLLMTKLSDDRLMVYGNLYNPGVSDVRLLASRITYKAPESATTSIEDFQSNDFVQVYPNPVQNVLNIRSIQNVEEWQVYDIQGRVVESGSTLTVNTSKLNKGVYYIKVKTELETIDRTFVVQ